MASLSCLLGYCALILCAWDVGLQVGKRGGISVDTAASTAWAFEGKNKRQPRLPNRDNAHVLRLDHLLLVLFNCVHPIVVEAQFIIGFVDGVKCASLLRSVAGLHIRGN